MLHFIMGRAGSGKTYCIRKQFVENPENAVLIVPEQYTFETERALFELGQGKHTFDEGEVLSFSRLCDRVFSLYGGVAEREYDSIIGTLIMGRALQTVANDLTIFKKCANRPEFVKSVISAFSEIKNNGISIEDMYKATEFLDDTPLSMKLGELAKIFTYYDTLAGERFSDKNDDLALLYEKLCENRYFEGKTVYFDSFKSFTGMQLKVISLIMAQAKEIYCTLCCDNLDASDPCDLFYTVKKTANDLIKLANDNNVAVASPVILNTPMRDRPDEIKYLEEVISENNAEKYIQ